MTGTVKHSLELIELTAIRNLTPRTPKCSRRTLSRYLPPKPARDARVRNRPASSFDADTVPGAGSAGVPSACNAAASLGEEDSPHAAARIGSQAFTPTQHRQQSHAGQRHSESEAGASNLFLHVLPSLLLQPTPVMWPPRGCFHGAELCISASSHLNDASI